MENNIQCAGDASDNDPECISLLLQFLHSLVELKLSKLIPFNERLVRLSLRWLQVEIISVQALTMLRTIALQDVGDSILEPILNVNNSLSLLLLELEHKTEEIPTNLEYNKKLSALIELLFSLLKLESLREKVLSIVHTEHLVKIFSPLLGDRSPRQRANDVDISSKEAVTLYVISLALIYEMSKYSNQWKEFYSNLIQQR